MGQVSTAEKLRGISLLPKLHQKTCYCKLFRKLHILGAKHSYFSENPFPLIVLWGSRWLCNSLTSDVGIIYIHYYFLMQSVHVWEKKNLLMKKTLHIIELDVLNLTVLQWYIHERGNNSHQIWTDIANSDSSGKCPSPVLPSLSQTDLTEHCTHQLHSYPQYCHFRLHRVYFWTYLVWEIFIIYQTKLLCSCKEFVFTLSIALQLSNLRILQFYVPVSSSLSICRVKNMLDKW